MAMNPNLLRADELGIKLEIVNGLQFWERYLVF
jgi:hypothetical protein